MRTPGRARRAVGPVVLGLALASSRPAPAQSPLHFTVRPLDWDRGTAGATGATVTPRLGGNGHSGGPEASAGAGRACEARAEP